MQLKNIYLCIFLVLLTVNLSLAQWGPSLKSLANSRGIYVGASVAGGYLAYILNNSNGIDPTYRSILQNQYSLTTNAQFYYGEVEPEPGVFDFTPADMVTSFAQQYNLVVRCHNLAWEQALPSWLNTTLSVNQAAAILYNHVKTIVTHMKGKCYAWDVVNEPIDDQTNTIRTSIWSYALGPNYIEVVLNWTHTFDPAAKLFLNDYLIEVQNNKSNALYSVIQQLKQNGSPINGIGFESHFQLGSLPNINAVQSNMARFVALGLELHVTEMDIICNNTLESIADKWNQQAAYFGAYLGACLATPGCKSFETWDYTDRYTWVGDLEGVDTTGGYIYTPLPFDATYNPKPAYYAIQSTLQNGYWKPSIIKKPRTNKNIIKKISY